MLWITECLLSRRVSAAQTLILFGLVWANLANGAAAERVTVVELESQNDDGEAAIIPVEDAAVRAREIRNVARSIRENYAKLRTLKGRFDVQDRQLVADPTVLKAVGADVSLPDAYFALHTASVSQVFIDFEHNKLFTTLEIKGTPSLITATGADQFDSRTVKALAVPNRAAIVTNNEFIYHHRDEQFGAFVGRPELGSNVTRAAFVEPVANAVAEKWGFLIDPRYLFWGDEFFPVELDRTADLNDLIANRRAAATVDRAVRVSRVEFAKFRRVIVTNRADDSRTNILLHYVADSRVGFNIVNFTVSSDGRTDRTLSIQYAKIQGVFLPAVATFSIPSSDPRWSRSPKNEFSRTLVLNDAEVNAPADPSWFTYKKLGLSDGDRIINRIDGKSYVLKNGEPIVVAPPPAPPPAPDSRGHNTAIVVANVVAVTCLMMFLYLRRRGRRRRKATHEAL